MANISETGSRATCTHELYFASLRAYGQSIVIPCDAAGLVNLDALPRRMRDVYLGARAMMGRDYAYPTIRIAH